MEEEEGALRFLMQGSSAQQGPLPLPSTSSTTSERLRSTEFPFLFPRAWGGSLGQAAARTPAFTFTSSFSCVFRLVFHRQEGVAPQTLTQVPAVLKLWQSGTAWCRSVSEGEASARRPESSGRNMTLASGNLHT
ncbi:hypothetical protein F7725_003925 [Dissostichus mawsoni]|uniref:Uncharacterized protein n=1 Tax=Dissostichus mawsoni TaxID=36200 RepID=A0A7J5YE73_DISMA|nr:hypothetical protein F7725_003925 [Dissostichus mawsoni]